jgi:DtxR family Mn-dependent transcriptional regulator
VSVERGLRDRQLPDLRVRISALLASGRLVPAAVRTPSGDVMGHYQDLAEHEIEELLEELWTLEEQGRSRRKDLREGSKLGDAAEVLERLLERGLVRVEADLVIMTPAGRELAARQVRRHRLAEFLLTQVIEVADERVVDETACVMEHILSPEVTDSVCSFLGHPKACPHGKPIPPGNCCRSFSTAIEPLVQPLDRLAVGSSARIVYIAPKEPELLTRLSSLGIVPAVTIRLQQKRPAAVIAIGETSLALDPESAAQIYVKRL